MQTQRFMHCISQEIDPKGKVNMHCSRHALIGLFGHCPEAKTHFTVSNPKHRFNRVFLTNTQNDLVSNIGIIANFVFPYICRFHLYFVTYNESKYEIESTTRCERL